MAFEDATGSRRHWRPQPELLAQREFATGADIEYALDAAENLAARALDDARHAQRVELTAYGMSLTLLGLAGVIVAVAGSTFLAVSTIAVATAAALLLTPIAVRVLVRPDRRLASLRADIAQELVAIVGESYVEIADREGWTDAHVRVTRLRLSAFPLRYAEAPPQPSTPRKTTRS